MALRIWVEGEASRDVSQPLLHEFEVLLALLEGRAVATHDWWNDRLSCHNGK